MFEFGLLLVFGFAMVVFFLFERDMRGYAVRNRRLLLEYLEDRRNLLGGEIQQGDERAILYGFEVGKGIASLEVDVQAHATKTVTTKWSLRCAIACSEELSFKVIHTLAAPSSQGLVKVVDADAVSGEILPDVMVVLHTFDYDIRMEWRLFIDWLFVGGEHGWAWMRAPHVLRRRPLAFGLHKSTFTFTGIYPDDVNDLKEHLDALSSDFDSQLDMIIAIERIFFELDTIAFLETRIPWLLERGLYGVAGEHYALLLKHGPEEQTRRWQHELLHDMNPACSLTALSPMTWRKEGANLSDDRLLELMMTIAAQHHTARTNFQRIPEVIVAPDVSAQIIGEARERWPLEECAQVVDENLERAHGFFLLVPEWRVQSLPEEEIIAFFDEIFASLTHEQQWIALDVLSSDSHPEHLELLARIDVAKNPNRRFFELFLTYLGDFARENPEWTRNDIVVEHSVQLVLQSDFPTVRQQADDLLRAVGDGRVLARLIPHVQENSRVSSLVEWLSHNDDVLHARGQITLSDVPAESGGLTISNLAATGDLTHVDADVDDVDGDVERVPDVSAGSKGGER